MRRASSSRCPHEVFHADTGRGAPGNREVPLCAVPGVPPGTAERRGERMRALEFELPQRLEAHEPPEARGLRRDDVRLLVARRRDGGIVHTHFNELPSFLAPGDLVVVNTSATLPAALGVRRQGGEVLELRLSTPAPHGPASYWIVELRRGDAPFGGAGVGESFVLPGEARAE